ncbi:MAG: helix-turn-helix domain-containing protein [Microcella sp.]|uniref:helix-turn-helix domain-containing protein n=1 Tax=Microcella sp. TaxID=1913979 RepID=UPI003314DC91
MIDTIDIEIGGSVSSADLLLHPVRLRIVQTMLGRDTLTTRELAAHVAGVAPATLYRHVSALVDAGVLDVVAERKVRGTVERSLRLRVAQASVSADDPQLADPATLRAGFLAYLGSLAALFDRYLEGERGNLEEDLVGFRQVAVHATDEEWREVMATVRAALAPLAERESAPARARRRVLGTVSLPVP